MGFQKLFSFGVGLVRGFALDQPGHGGTRQREGIFEHSPVKGQCSHFVFQLLPVAAQLGVGIFQSFFIFIKILQNLLVSRIFTEIFFPGPLAEGPGIMVYADSFLAVQQQAFAVAKVFVVQRVEVEVAGRK